MLRQHDYYVYYDGSRVYARMGDRPPVLARECKTPQEAHDFVQRIINPEGKRKEDFAQGFNDPQFQKAISASCEAFVRDAYARAGEED
jgi:hypothetical protein